MGHAHAHTHRSGPEQERRLAWAAALNLVIVVVQVVAGLVAGSLGLLSDAAHNLSDVGAVLLSLVALRLMRRPATERRTFGFSRAGVLAAQANAAGLVAVSALLLWTSVGRLSDPPAVDGAVVLVAALLGAVVNAGAAALVHDPAGDDLNSRGALLHLLSDAVVSVGVAASGLVVLLTGGAAWLDPTVALLISLLVGAYGIALLRGTTDVLLESAPKGLDVAALTRDLEALPGVRGIHDLHVWSVSDRLLAASGHVLVAGQPTLAQASATVAQAKELLRDRYGIGHATLESESEDCAPEDLCR